MRDIRMSVGAGVFLFTIFLISPPVLYSGSKYFTPLLTFYLSYACFAFVLARLIFSIRTLLSFYIVRFFLSFPLSLKWKILYDVFLACILFLLTAALDYNHVCQEFYRFRFFDIYQFHESLTSVTTYLNINIIIF